MKHLLLILLLTCTGTAAFAQHNHSGHQRQDQNAAPDTVRKGSVDEVGRKQLSQLRASYYNIKNALVAGDAGSAAFNAGLFLRTANSIDYKLISEGNVHALSRDAGRISGTKDIERQRVIFAALSSNFAEIVKALKPGADPIYLQYCPMKKAEWLSAEKELRNPYFGSAMLSCGEVRETL